MRSILLFLGPGVALTCLIIVYLFCVKLNFEFFRHNLNVLDDEPADFSAFPLNLHPVVRYPVGHVIVFSPPAPILVGETVELCKVVVMNVETRMI